MASGIAKEFLCLLDYFVTCLDMFDQLLCQSALRKNVVAQRADLYNWSAFAIFCALANRSFPDDVVAKVLLSSAVN